MSEEILSVLTQMSNDIGHIKGTTDGIKETFAAHVAQDTLVQTEIFHRLGSLELAHAATVGKAVAFKTMFAALGTGIGVAADFFGRKLFHHP